MARLSTATTDRVGGLTYSAPTNFSVAVWYKPHHAPNTGGAFTRLAYAQSTSPAIDWGLSWDHTSSSFNGTWFFKDTSQAYSSCRFTGVNFVPGIWYLLGTSFIAGASLFIIWLNGRMNNTSTPGLGPQTGNTQFDAIGSTNNGGVVTSPLGVVGQCGWWSEPLSADNWKELAKGIPFGNVRRNTLFSWLPMIGLGNTEIDRADGALGVATRNGTFSARDYVLPIAPPLPKQLLFALTPPPPPSGKLFLPSSLSGLGAGGPFFHDRLSI